jgi:hypothetical protein
MTAEDANIALVNADLERVATTHGDLTETVYARFFDTSPESEALLCHTDSSMQGRMLQQTLELLLSDEHLAPGGYLDWELDNHLIGYRVTRSMYQAFMETLCDVIVSGAPPPTAAAWRARSQQIMHRIDAFEARRRESGGTGKNR